MTWIGVLTFLAALGSGLMAGLFFIFSNTIMPALAKRPAPVGIAAMQSIDETILNPVFFIVFFGTAVLSAGLAVVGLLHWQAPTGGWSLHPDQSTGAGWAFGGGILYLVGSIGVTMRGNVPLNNQLAKVAPDSDEGAALWSRYLKDWTRLNHIRTLSCMGAMVCFMLALL